MTHTGRAHSKIAVASQVLETGGVVFLPTDTVFGLAAKPDIPDAVSKVFILKLRPPEKNLPLMVSAVEQLEAIGAQLNERVQRLVDSPFCPGPISIAVGLNKKSTPKWLTGRDELAFRIPNDGFLLDLLYRIGPLFVTSANRSGAHTAATVEEALAGLSGVPDLIIGGQQCDNLPSTLVNCRYAKPIIERVGAVSVEALSEYLV